MILCPVNCPLKEELPLGQEEPRPQPRKRLPHLSLFRQQRAARLKSPRREPHLRLLQRRHLSLPKERREEKPLKVLLRMMSLSRSKTVNNKCHNLPLLVAVKPQLQKQLSLKAHQQQQHRKMPPLNLRQNRHHLQLVKKPLLLSRQGLVHGLRARNDLNRKFDIGNNE